MATQSLSWTLQGVYSSQELYYGESAVVGVTNPPNAGWTPVVIASNANTASVTGLLDNTAYKYVVRAFCSGVPQTDLVGTATTNPPGFSVTPDCPLIGVTETFVEGTSSVGSFNIPITVVGTGTVTATISGTGFSGSNSIVGATSSNTFITVNVVYDGSAPSGNRTVTVTINGTACNVVVIVDPAAPICNPPTNLIISNI